MKLPLHPSKKVKKLLNDPASPKYYNMEDLKAALDS